MGNIHICILIYIYIYIHISIVNEHINELIAAFDHQEVRIWSMMVS